MLAAAESREDPFCVISGDSDNLVNCWCIPSNYTKEVKSEYILQQEWFLCLPRGGITRHLKTRENSVILREDISDMFSRSEFILAPTYKTYLDVLKYIDMAGIKHRKENDTTPRRPMTSIASSEGLYHYVFIPCTDAARALQERYNLQPQTQEDLSHGISPLDNKPFLVGSDQFPVVECYTHPFSISKLAYKQLRYKCTILTGQWFALTGNLKDIWHNKDIKVPQWFIDSPKVDDERLRSVYAIEPTVILRETKIPDTDPRKAVADWACNKIDPDAPPPPELPPSPQVITFYTVNLTLA
ncbi:hypothetical protein EV714DRAFT_275247 [Schizophyllum commune]